MLSDELYIIYILSNQSFQNPKIYITARKIIMNLREEKTKVLWFGKGEKFLL